VTHKYFQNTTVEHIQFTCHLATMISCSKAASNVLSGLGNDSLCTCRSMWSGCELKPAVCGPGRASTGLPRVYKLLLNFLSWFTVEEVKQLIVQSFLAGLLTNGGRFRLDSDRRSRSSRIFQDIQDLVRIPRVVWCKHGRVEKLPGRVRG